MKNETSENLNVKRSVLSVARSPDFDPKLATPVPPTRYERPEHPASGRTFCFVQGDDLFSATGVHVATDQAAAAAAAPAAAQ